MFSIFYDGKSIKAGVPFDAPDDWLKHISISFENKSSQPLVAGSFQLDFRELGGIPWLFYDLRFGVLPEHQLDGPLGRRASRTANESPISVAPGEVASIPFEPKYAELRAAIETRSLLAQVNACWISYGFYYFGKDLRWGLGSFTRANPSAPGYLPVSPKDILSNPPPDR